MMWIVRRVILGQLNILGLAAGVRFMLGEPSAAYLLAGGIISALVLGLANTWVLLIEILR